MISNKYCSITEYFQSCHFKMISKKLTANGIKCLRLITLDMTGTVFKFKRAPYLDYMDTASSLGVSNIVEKELASSFRVALKSVSKEFPNFGSTSGISSEDWWNIVINRTFKGAIKDMTPEIEEKLNVAASNLYNLYSTNSPYEVFPDAKRFLERLLPERQEGKLKVGIISNYDKRIVKMVKSLDLSAYFDFITYSEESKCSKPEKGIFDDAMSKSGLMNLAANEVLHIGDDLDKDYWGARKMGWNGLLITRDEVTRSKLLNGLNNPSSSSEIKLEDICDSFCEIEDKLFDNK